MFDIELKGMWNHLQPFAWLLGVVLAGIVVGSVAHLIVWYPIRRFARRTQTVLDDILDRRWRHPTRYVFATLAVYLLLPLISGQLSDWAYGVVSGILTALLTATLVFALIKLIYVAEEVILHRFQVDVRDNLRARQIHTQVRILRRLSIALIVFLGLGVVFFSFERFRELGTGILASAGIAGLVIGLAAQRTLSNLLAGIQIAITQPIRLDDVVIVENEWGRIEEITLTYVVVRIWDLRRLILPISYFIEKPFQNWTRVSADILGTVFIYVDYTVPVDAIREELTRILQNSPNWDKKVNIVQVTNASEKTVEVRALMSAADASMAWDLRCDVRECLIAFLKKSYPEALPRARVELDQRGSTNYGDIDGNATDG